MRRKIKRNFIVKQKKGKVWIEEIDEKKSIEFLTFQFFVFLFICVFFGFNFSLPFVMFIIGLELGLVIGKFYV